MPPMSAGQLHTIYAGFFFQALPEDEANPPKHNQTSGTLKRSFQKEFD